MQEDGQHDDRQVRDALYYVAESSLRVHNRAQFFTWSQGPLQTLIPHDILICGMPKSPGGPLAMHRFTASRYFRDEHFQAVCDPRNGVVARIYGRWRKTSMPVLVAPEGSEVVAETDWLRDLLRHELKNFAAHGLCGAAGDVVGFFGFGRVGAAFDFRLVRALHLGIPHVLATFARVLSAEETRSPGPRSGHPLTTREIEVLEWVSAGKTNEEIALILAVSALTIKNHLHHVYRKLDVHTRGQAVARAIALGFLKTGIGRGN